mgnify:CR=1 FL=1
MSDFVEIDSFRTDLIESDPDTSSFLSGPEYLRKLGIPLERVSCDKKNPSSNGYRFIEVCKNTNLFIVNGRVGSDRNVGKVTSKGVSLIDYAVCSPKIFSIIDEFCVLDFCNLLSDVHSPIVLTLNFCFKSKQEKMETQNIPRKWVQEKSNTFVEKISETEIAEIIDLLDNYGEIVDAKVLVETVAKKFVIFF